MASAVGHQFSATESQVVPPPPNFPPPSLPSPSEQPPPPPPPPPSQQPHDNKDQRRDERKKHEEEKRRREKERAEREKARVRKEAEVKKQQAEQQRRQTPSLMDNRLRRDTPFQATIRFKNDLPEIPGDPKMIVPQLHPDRLAAFKLTSLEREPKRELLLPHDLGIPISLLDVERYAVPESGPAPLDPADKALLAHDLGIPIVLLDVERCTVPESGLAPLDPADKALLAHDLGIPIALLDVKRYPVPESGPALVDPADKGDDEKLSLHNHNLSANPRMKPRAIAQGEVSWLMRTTYISHDAHTVPKPGYSEKQAKSIRKVPLSVTSDDAKGAFQDLGHAAASGAEIEEDQGLDAQIAAIEASFEAAKKTPVHAKNPALKAMEILPVLPDFACWANKYVQAHFDNDPTEEVEQLSKLPSEAKRLIAARCMLKSFKLDIAKKEDTQGGSQAATHEKIMALVVPSDQTLSEEETGPSDLEGDYMWSREYAYDLIRRDGGVDGNAALSNPELSKQEFFIRFQDGVASYCDIFARLELRKRGEMSEKRGEAVQFERPSKVIIRKRDVTEAELEEKARKMRRLYGEEEE
eukprot:gene28376-31509_t